jgi:hypothetical protein
MYLSLLMQISTSTSSPCSQTVCGVTTNAASGTVVKVTYLENGIAKTATSTASNAGVLSALQTYNGVTSTNSRYKIGEVFSVSVVDRDANVDSAVAESVRVTASMMNDRETVVLVETGVNTGVFTGLLTTNEEAATVVGDGRISPVTSTKQVLIICMCVYIYTHRHTYL